MKSWGKTAVPIALSLIMVMTALSPLGLFSGAPPALGDITHPVTSESQTQTAVTTDSVHASASTPSWNFPSPSSVNCFGAKPVTIAGVEIPNGSGIHWIGGNNGSGVKTFPRTVIINETCSFSKAGSVLMRYNLTDENPATTIYVVNSSLKMEQQSPAAGHGYRDISTVGSLYLYNSTIAANNTTGNLHWSTDANGTASLDILLGNDGAFNGGSECPTTWQPVFYANNAKLQNNTSVDWGSAYGFASTVTNGVNASWPTCTANADFYVVNSNVNGTLATGAATSEILNTVITQVGQKDTSTTPWTPVLLDANVTSSGSKLTTFSEPVNGLLVKTYFPAQYPLSKSIGTTQCPQAAVTNNSVGIVEVCAFSSSPFKASPPLNSTVIDNVTVENVNASATDVLVSLNSGPIGTYAQDSLSYITLAHLQVNITSLDVKVHGDIGTVTDVQSSNQVTGGAADELTFPVTITGYNVTAISSVASAGFGIPTNTYIPYTTLTNAYLYVQSGSYNAIRNVGMVVPFANGIVTGIETYQFGAYALIDNATIQNTLYPETNAISEITTGASGSTYFSTICTAITCPDNLTSLLPTSPSSLVNDANWPMLIVAQSNLKEIGTDSGSNLDQLITTQATSQTNVVWDNTLFMNSTYALPSALSNHLDAAHVFYDASLGSEVTTLAADYLYGNTITVNSPGGIGVVEPGYYLNMTSNVIKMTSNDNISVDHGLDSIVDNPNANSVLDIYDNTITGSAQFTGPNAPTLTDWFAGKNGVYTSPPLILFSSDYNFFNTMYGFTTIQGMSGNTVVLSGPAEDFNGITWGGAGSINNGNNVLSFFGGYHPNMVGVTSSHDVLPQMTNMSAIPVDGIISGHPLGVASNTYKMQIDPVVSGVSNPSIVGNTFNDSSNSVFWTSGGDSSFFTCGYGNFQVNNTWTVGMYYTTSSQCRGISIVALDQNPVVIGPNTWIFDSTSFFTYQSPNLVVENTKVPQMMLSYCQSGDTCLSNGDSSYYTTLFVDATSSGFVAAPVSSEVAGSTYSGEDVVYGTDLQFDTYYAPGHAWSLTSSKYGTVLSATSSQNGAPGSFIDGWWIVNEYFTVNALQGVSAPSMTWTVGVDGTNMYSFTSTESLGMFVQSFNANSTATGYPLAYGYLKGSDMEMVLSDAPTTTVILPSDITVPSLGTAMWSPIYAGNGGMLDGNVTVPIATIDLGMKTSFPVIQASVPYGSLQSFTLPSQGTAWDLGTPSVPVFYSTSPVQFFVSPGAAQGTIDFNLGYIPTKVWASSINSTENFGVSSVAKKLLGYEYYATWAGTMVNLPSGVSQGQVVYDVVAGDAAYNTTSHWAKPDGTLSFYATDINFAGLQVGSSSPYALFVNALRVPNSGSQFFATDPAGNFSYTMTPENTTYVVEALFTQATGLLWYQTSTFDIALLIIVVAAAALGVLWYYDRAVRSRPRRRKSRRAMA